MALSSTVVYGTEGSKITQHAAAGRRGKEWSQGACCEGCMRARVWLGLSLCWCPAPNTPDEPHILYLTCFAHDVTYVLYCTVHVEQIGMEIIPHTCSFLCL